MPDYGAAYADKALRDIDRELRSTYRTAKRELEKKLKDFNARHALKDKAKRQQLAQGKITKQDYQNWLAGQVFIRGQWESKIRQVSKVIQDSNRQALNILNERRLDVFAENYNFNSFWAENIVGGVSFGLYNAQAVARLITEEPQMLPEWKIDEEKDYEWNYKKVNNLVRQGIIQGEGIPEITKHLCAGLATQNENKMRMFARTAITGAQNAGRQRQMEDAAGMNIEQHKQWIATHDSRTRDAHRAMDGEEVPYNEDFSNGLEYPGDPSGTPAQTYNCRCTMVTIYPKYEDRSQSRRRYEEEIDGQSYEEWKRGKKKQTGEAVPGENVAVKPNKPFVISKEIRDNVTRQEASDDWFEYEYANLMREYIQTGKMPERDMYNRQIDENMRQRLAAEAELIQDIGKGTKTQYKTLYRGMVLDEQTAYSLFQKGGMFEFDSLSATSPDKKIANIYMDIENFGGEGIPVLLEIQKSDGIFGFKRDDLETVLPKGSSFRVERTYQDSNGVFHVSLYSKKGNNITAEEPRQKGMKLDLQQFAEKDLKKQELSSLKKGIESLQDKIELHKDKIRNPEKYVSDWDELDKRKQDGTKRHWQKEIKTFEKGISERQEEIEKRGGEE